MIPPIRPRLLLPAVLMLLVGCAKSDPLAIDYREDASRFGFYDTPVRKDAFEVGYVGEVDSAIEGAAFGASVRAAEITIDHQRTHFDVLLRRNQRYTYTIWVPPQYTTILNSYVNSAGQTVTVQQQIMTSPGRWESHATPIATILVRLSDGKSPAAVDALSTLRVAASRGLKLSEAARQKIESRQPGRNDE